MSFKLEANSCERNVDPVRHAATINVLWGFPPNAGILRVISSRFTEGDVDCIALIKSTLRCFNKLVFLRLGFLLDSHYMLYTVYTPLLWEYTNGITFTCYVEKEFPWVIILSVNSHPVLFITIFLAWSGNLTKSQIRTSLLVIHNTLTLTKGEVSMVIDNNGKVILWHRQSKISILYCNLDHILVPSIMWHVIYFLDYV